MMFEEKLLMELKAEVSERAPREHARRTRKITGRRMVTGAAVVTITAAAVAALPFVIGSEPPAYAMTRNADGSITVQVNDLREPERLEADLARQGVRSDITYLKWGQSCTNDPYYGGNPLSPEEREELRKRPVVDSRGSRLVRIVPSHLEPGQTVILRFIENKKGYSVLGTWVINGPVRPCTIR